MSSTDPALPPATRQDIETDRRGTGIGGRNDETETAQTVPVFEEEISVSKRAVKSGAIRVSTRTDTIDEIVDVSLDHDVMEVTHVSIGRIVETAPLPRTEGDTTIIPIIEERFIVVKQLYLKEEMHLRRRIETEMVRAPVQLRRQTGIVERFDEDGQPVIDTPARKI